ncbi:VTT domain-containing protein [Pseudalkalibacillus caeni]|uniref:DedA family protein n=1 Tax=Exobacillus caeni TaxID=2574798 RepID=A0A5R9EZ24_9BACL|nr:VTT domain-containing protein [Pseudalkalibacillus caeni]TLS36447.1 DedA family protein [Pseudalkalibacillus caeni]
MEQLFSIFEQHSYLILFLSIFLELLALPISAEFFMSYSGYYIFAGKMIYPLALITAFSASVLSITLTYWIGKSGGYKLVEKYGKYIHLGPSRYQKVSRWFARSGSKLLIFAYFIPGIRHFTGYISGISRISFWRFAIPAYTGAAIWTFSFITLGKVLGPKWEVFHQAAQRYLIVLILIVLLIIIAYILFRLYKKQIKDMLVMLMDYLLLRLRTATRTDVFLAFLSLSLLGFTILMLGMVQDYLFNEFNRFNEVTVYILQSFSGEKWIHALLTLQTTVPSAILITACFVFLIKKSSDRLVDFLLLAIPLLGAPLYFRAIKKIMSLLHSFGVGTSFLLEDFPNKLATITMIVIGTSVYLFARHSVRNVVQILFPISGLLLLSGLAVANISTAAALPSNVLGGYVYGGVWIFLNFLFFELVRITAR